MITKKPTREIRMIKIEQKLICLKLDPTIHVEGTIIIELYMMKYLLKVKITDYTILKRMNSLNF